MSKIGKKNISIPKESSIKIEGANLTISGPKGTKKLTINDKIFSSKLNESVFLLEPLEKKVDKKLIKDSKKLNKKKREILEKYIKKNSIWSVGSSSKKEIEKLNILEATMLAMERTIKKLRYKPN